MQVTKIRIVSPAVVIVFYSRGYWLKFFTGLKAEQASFHKMKTSLFELAI